SSDGSKDARRAAPGARLPAGVRHRESAAAAWVRRTGSVLRGAAEAHPGRRSVLAAAGHARVPALAPALGGRLRTGGRARAQAAPAAALRDELLGGAAAARDGLLLERVRRIGSGLAGADARSAAPRARRIPRRRGGRRRGLGHRRREPSWARRRPGAATRAQDALRGGEI